MSDNKESKLVQIVVGRDMGDLVKFGKTGTICIGKHIVGSGEDAHLTTPVLMDVLRPHEIVIAGKRGSGKCLHEDSLIMLDDGRNVSIKDLENVTGDVITLDDGLKITKTQREGFYKRTVDKLIHVKLRSGREVKLTPEHPLLTIKGWKPAATLPIGSRIATPRKLAFFGNNEMPEHEIKLLAYMIAEGHISKKMFFSNSDDKINDDFIVSVKKFDSNLQVRKIKKDHYDVTQIKPKTKSYSIIRDSCGRISKGSYFMYDKSSIAKLFVNVGLHGKLSREKFIPDAIFSLKKENIALFLNRLFSCDGSIYKTNGHWEISYCSSSENMIHQVQHLILRFGVLSKIRKKKIKCNGKEFGSFELVINGQFVDTFNKEIGFFGKKEERQKEALTKKVNRNPNVDTIPIDVWELYAPKSWFDIGRAFGYKFPKAMRESQFYAPSRQKLLQIATVDNNNPLRLLAESDIFWDEIVSMEILEGEFTVYDISVPDYHNFVANDIFVHNSYSMGVYVEELMKLPDDVRQNLCSVLIDTQGIFWTMKSPNEKDTMLLAEWDSKPQGFPVFVYVPEGQSEIFKKAGVDFDGSFSLSADELSAEDWLGVFELDANQPLGILVQQTVNKLRKTRQSYNIDDITNEIKSRQGFESEKLALENRFEVARAWGIFGASKMPKLLEPGRTTIVDVSLTPQNVRSLLVGLISRKIYLERTIARRKEELAETEGTVIKRVPMCWIFIDEAHNFMPDKGNPPSLEILLKLVREGRQPGITLVLATQRPEKLHPDSLAQCDLLISHMLTAKADIEALKSIMQTYMLFDLTKYFNDLPKLKGVALILDDNSERLYSIRMRPRQSWHAGSSPVAIR